MFITLDGDKVRWDSAKGFAAKDFMPELWEYMSGEAGVQSNWQSIETAPRDGTEIIIFVPGVAGGVQAARWCSPHSDHSDEFKAWCVDDGKHGPWPIRGWRELPTHWQPLPEAPSEEGS